MLGVGHLVSDQVGLNLLINTTWFNKVLLAESDRGWACHCGTLLDPSKFDIHDKYLQEPKPQIKEDGVYSASGNLYCFVHQYDRVPELQSKIN
jgi:hypothetical protein